MSTKKTQTNFLLLLLSFVVISAIIVIRFLSPEDSWICQNGNWVKHGNPLTTKPSTICDSEVSANNSSYVYFSNTKKSGSNYDCSLVYPVERNIFNITPETALIELFAGPTAAEKSQGYSSFFSEKTKSILKGVKVQNNIAYVNLTDIRKIIPNVSTSCGSKQFTQQIKLTLMRTNSNINDIRFAINSNPQTFYNWIQIGCDKKLNNCDPKPFN